MHRIVLAGLSVAASYLMAYGISMAGCSSNADNAVSSDTSAEGSMGEGDASAGDASSGCGLLDGAALPDAAAFAAQVPRVDQIAYYSELTAHRPDLLSYPADGGGTGSLCYQAMMIRPIYRPELLDGGPSVTPRSLENETDADVHADQAWIAEQQSDELSYCASHPGGGCHSICNNGKDCAACPDASVGDPDAARAPYYVSGYPLCAFVGYKSGPDVDIYDTHGLAWLVYFTFKAPDTDLTPARMRAYGQALACAGFQGDFKILTDPLLPQQGRFQYNDIVVHGHSEHDAELAEAIGLSTFQSNGQTLLSATGRGLDVNPLVWAEYLCAGHGNLSTLNAKDPHAVPFSKYQE